MRNQAARGGANPAAGVTPHRSSRLTWLFDLDNTLHNASPHIFPHINRSMTQYICEHLQVDEEQATRIRQDYWVRYGATLLGLVRHHGTDPRHFLQQTHDFPNLASMVVFERGLRAMLRRLPGRKIVFSNAPRHYAEAVLNLLGIRQCFDSVYTVERLRFLPKPAPGSFRHLLRRERLVPERCVMIEDTLANLEAARQLGLKTVWISSAPRKPGCVDVKLRSVLELPAHVHRF